MSPHPHPTPEARGLPPLTVRRRVRDRRFEALYMQSFIEMRARSAKR